MVDADDEFEVRCCSSGWHRMNVVYVTHPDVNDGVEIRLDGVRVTLRSSSILMTVPPDVYRTLNAIVPGPRTPPFRLRIVREAGETIAACAIIASARRLPGGGAELTLRATGAIRTERLGAESATAGQPLPGTNGGT